MRIECSKREVITSQDIQNDYMKFYSCMMQYLWSEKAVEHLAELEISIFKRFPDKEEMSNCIRILEYDIADTYKDEEDMQAKEFKKNFELLKEDIEDFEEVGYDIFKIDEVKDVDKILDEDIEESTPKEKKTIQVGKIVTK